MEQKSSEHKRMYLIAGTAIVLLLAVIGNYKNSGSNKWYDNPGCCNCMGKGTVTSFGTTMNCKYCHGSGHLSEATYNEKCK